MNLKLQKLKLLNLVFKMQIKLLKSYRKSSRDRSIFCMKMYKIRCKNNKKKTLDKYHELNQLCLETLKNYQTRP